MKEVKIGNQIWMIDNLNVANFRNGDPIPEAKTEDEWKKAGENKQPAWCYYNNDPANGEIFGKLYNWYAVNDARGLAPEGWHIPSDTEWTALIDYLGGKDVAGTKMKSTSWSDNVNDSRNGTNESGFSGLPGGVQGDYGVFSGIGAKGRWWTSTEDGSEPKFDVSFSLVRLLVSHNGRVFREGGGQTAGFSVRCIRD
jgi:uncharacterized protein (TIGR02145 family)